MGFLSPVGPIMGIDLKGLGLETENEFVPLLGQLVLPRSHFFERGSLSWVPEVFPCARGVASTHLVLIHSRK